MFDFFDSRFNISDGESDEEFYTRMMVMWSNPRTSSDDRKLCVRASIKLGSNNAEYVHRTLDFIKNIEPESYDNYVGIAITGLIHKPAWCVPLLAEILCRSDVILTPDRWHQYACLGVVNGADKAFEMLLPKCDINSRSLLLIHDYLWDEAIYYITCNWEKDLMNYINIVLHLLNDPRLDIQDLRNSDLHCWSLDRIPRLISSNFGQPKYDYSSVIPKLLAVVETDKG